MGHHRHLLLLLILTSFSLKCQSWGWFSPPAKNQFDEKASGTKDNSGLAEFSMEGFNDPNGKRLVESAKKKLVGTNTCWQNAYQHLFAECSEIFTVDEKRSKFAWHLGDCFQKDYGRPPFPFCDPKSAMVKCLKNLNEDEHKGSRIQATNREIASTTKDVGDHIDVVLKHSEVLYEQSKELAATQLELQEGQVEMRRSLVDGMATLKDSYNILGQEIDSLRNEAIELEKGITKVGDAMSMKMRSLQSKADDIRNMAGVSLDKQQQLLDGQSTTLEGLQILTKFQSKAPEESRSTLQQLAEYGHRQQEELLRRQE
ncbi:hypothetical protein SO802_018183 [Lithocarpus litseifolius]|uniref:Uncharacterized protein n=1 Tax=Lithocarpus litseifolius TaxID=425828 RepID=A0AAW2CPX2_9ROSI